MICKEWDDLRVFMIKCEVEPLRELVRSEELSKEEYISKFRDCESKAKELWGKLVESNIKFFNKDKFLDIEYLSDKKTYRRKPLSRGRPSVKEKKDNRITIRLNDNEMKILENYCRTKNMSESKAVRYAIRRLY